ncbi:YciI family protein [bacterium]|nr:YciI family protein [bacterium]
MKYMFTITTDPALMPSPGSPAFEEMLAGYFAFGEELKRRGKDYQGAPLQAPPTATTVRIRDGKKFHVDGPFAETKEWMSGYYVFDCRDLDEALELAALIPGSRFGSVEVRPVADMGADPKGDAEKAGASLRS